ncbi:mitochondrial outer membrane protein SLC25A46 [Onthophagus taurus]|uniref:mitochondrial outer membrane protein SLC25A46 n=1 Tax=Onthophagus taurus TaxID=166361 RepID=UPI000C1FDC36|nr:solute carrier family 25 member 46 [Onthophagus taurus]
MAGLREFNARNFYNLNEDVMWDPNLAAGVPLPIPTANPKINDDDAALQKYVGQGVSVVSLIAENLLCHPFVVLRRQCQVHYNSRKIHVVPITLVPVIMHLHQHQGITTLWKGLGSTLLIRGLSLGVEDLISKVTPWPKEITWYSTVTQFLQHTLLKGLSLAIVTPFYSASLVETVQSDIASEKPGILDVFREGFMRLLNWGGGPKGRMLPVWALVLPTVTLGLARYFFSLGLEGLISRLMHRNFKHRHEATGALPRNLPNTNAMKEIDFNASLIATIASDVAFYPFETILHRLHLQGTRTIVDNLDDGSSVLPILTNYHGPVDCYESCLAKEGIFGLYKGFGALILQYAAHIAVIRITRFLLTEITAMMHKPSRTAGTHSPPVISNTNNTGHTYLLP